MRYVALLRGVNVGGNNKLVMADLRAALAQVGLEEVSSYINSGNLIFTAGEQAADTLARRCEAVIHTVFGLEIRVLVLSAPELLAAADRAPDWWGRDPDSVHNALFVLPPDNAAGVCAEVGAIRPEYEQIAHHGRVIFWSAPRKTYSRTRWSKIIGTAAYAKLTIRNANTTRKLAGLLR